MIEGLRRLLDLQSVDDELVVLEDEQAAIPERRSRLQEGRDACEQSLAGARQGVTEAEADQRRAESDLRDREALLHKLEGQQFQVKSNEAYTALLLEIEQAKQAVSDSETRILESMESIEGARATLASAEQEAGSKTSEFDAEERAISEREGQLADEIPGVRQRRDAVCAEIEAELLARYAKIRRRPAVVMISKELCSGCRVDIPAQNYIELLRGEKIIACGNCQRILVAQEKLSAAAS